MTDSLWVILDDEIAGTLTRVRGRLRFDYDATYEAQPGRTPLSLSMPVQVASHADHAVSPWLWGLLPDNAAVLRRWAREFHVSATSVFALLATPVGEDCAGAVRFAPPDQLERVLSRTGEVAWLTDEEVSERLRELREDATAWLGRSFTGQFSLAGAQAKTALLWNGTRWGVPSGAIATTHILKPAVTGLDDHDLNEHLCLDAARRSGLIAAQTRASEFGGETAVVVRRYDRVTDPDGNVIRVHQEDLCQALGIPPSGRYQNDGGPTPPQVARLLRDAMPPQFGEEAVRRFADALIWNWLIGGTDAHAKNYSLLLAGDQVRLAPLYDIASALPYGVQERKLRLAMKMGSSYDVYPGRNRWPDVAHDLGLEPEWLVDRSAELARLAPAALSDAAAVAEVRALGSALPDVLIDLVADRARRCLGVLRR